MSALQATSAEQRLVRDAIVMDRPCVSRRTGLNGLSFSRPAGASEDWGASVAIYRLLQNAAFQPEDTRRMAEAYELALVAMRIQNRDDPLTETLAQYIIEIAQTGEKDPARICALAVARVRSR